MLEKNGTTKLLSNHKEQLKKYSIPQKKATFNNFKL